MQHCKLSTNNNILKNLSIVAVENPKNMSSKLPSSAFILYHDVLLSLIYVDELFDKCESLLSQENQEL